MEFFLFREMQSHILTKNVHELGTMKQKRLSEDFNVFVCFVQITKSRKSVHLLIDTRIFMIFEVYFQQYMSFKFRFDLLDLPVSLDILML